MNTIKFLKDNEFNGLTDAVAIREKFRSFGINVSYENLADAKTQRFIFTSTKQSRFKYENDMVLEANGLVLEAPEWKPLVIPPQAPVSNVLTKIVNKALSQNKYDIYYIEDGTVVNLYFNQRNNAWTLSTLKGIDVNNLVFNNLSYKVMFDEVMIKNNIIVDSFYSSLNKECSYTFGFKHPDLHPFMEGKGEPIYKIWFIQRTNTKTKLVSKLSQWSYIKGHTRVTFQVKSVGALFNKLNGSYDKFLEKGISLYGFLLFAKQTGEQQYMSPEGFIENKNHASIILESSLMKYIRNLWYDASYTSFSRQNDYNRNKTILINSFLDNNRIDIFNKLFPQFVTTMNNLVDSEINLVETIYKRIMDNKGKSLESGEAALNSDESHKTIQTDWAADIPEELNHDNIENDIINTLCLKVTNSLSIDKHEKPKQKIRDIVHTTDHIDHYYKLLC